MSRRIIVSITSISLRAASLHRTLESLLDQDMSGFEVQLNISKLPFLLDEGMPAPPDECLRLVRNGNLSWSHTPNIGPYRKLLPVLARGLRADDIVVTADDDTIYPRDWLRSLIYYYDEYRCIIASRGHFMSRNNGGFRRYREWMNTPGPDGPSLFYLPTGKDGVLYSPIFFNENVMNFRSALRIATTADDLWFKWHTAANRVPVYLVNKNYKEASFEDTNEGASLYRNYNLDGGNDRTIASLEEYSSTSLGYRHVEL